MNAADRTRDAAPTPNDAHEEDLELFNRVMDAETAEALFRSLSVLALAIEATDGRSLDRTYLEWPYVAKTVWELLDGVMIRAGVSDGQEKPWERTAEAAAGA